MTSQPQAIDVGPEATEKEGNASQHEAFGRNGRRVYRPQNEQQKDFKFRLDKDSCPVPLATAVEGTGCQSAKMKHKGGSNRKTTKQSTKKVQVRSDGDTTVKSDNSVTKNKLPAHHQMQDAVSKDKGTSSISCTDELSKQVSTLDIHGSEKQEAVKCKTKKKEKHRKKVRAGAEGKEVAEQLAGATKFKPRKVCHQPGGSGGGGGSQSKKSEHRITLENLLQNLEIKKNVCTGKHKEEISKLKKEAGVKQKTFTVGSFGDLDEIMLKNKLESEHLRQAIDESNRRMDVFLQFHTELEEQIQELKPDKEHILLQMSACFERECNRYDKALPIYAYKLEIMRTIMDHQVCVVIGETGSGKSTQLVQYLCEAGLASGGRKIACTQPRKLAAMSLAKHVSEEVNEPMGKTYDCITTTKHKNYQNVEVLFMTDHTLLNECIADPSLSKYSCLVIDEAHERSIHTDILIAFIKRCLPNRPDLKVIITSATINPTLFSCYFRGQEKCPVITVPGRTYPVEVEWNDFDENPIINRDYVTEAVQKVYDIHIKHQNKPGDILVFLTCPAEIEKACKLAKDSLKNKATVLPLHGKLQPEEQQKVFETIKGKRKVVFATNVAETSITIPGIRYVIDTGLSKEMFYDPHKNMNSLEIRPISKSSADQRKGRAGRTSSGECYRLYSDKEYQKMRDHSTPEILRITLAFAVIKLYEFGLEDIHSFEFVESPDRKALDDAIANLKFLGAIKTGKLTKLGRKMALLPLEPNLSKVLLDAIDAGIGTEAMAAVAVSTLAGRVFFRPSDDESRDESDRKRVPFCQESGDQMTYLHTYYEWSCQERKNQNKWCVENFVNAKSMRMVEQLVNELMFILRTKLHITIPAKIVSLAKADDLLPRIFFNAFLQNICIHLGHDKIGYWCENLPEAQLIIYYGSSLRYLSSTPQCVVFEKTQKTSEHFLLQVLPVREEWISDAVRTGQLKCHPSQSSLYNLYRVSPITFSNLGSFIFSKLRQRYPQGKSTRFNRFDVQPYFEHLGDAGVIKVFLQECFHEDLRESIAKFVEPLKKELQEESHEHGAVGNNDDVKVVLGSGGCIQQLLMPDDFRCVIVRGFSGEQLVSCVEDELKEYGECSSRVMRNQKDVQLFVKYKHAEDAARALNHQFLDGSLTIRRCRDQNRNQFSLKVEWVRRKRQDYTFINFEENIFHLLRVQGSSAVSIGFMHYYDSSSGLGFQLIHRNNSIKVTKIHDEVTEEDVLSGLYKIFPFVKDLEDLQEDIKVIFVYDKKSFGESDESFQEHRECLDGHLSACVPRTDYYLDFHYPYPKNVKYRAYVQCEDSGTCIKLLQCLSSVKCYQVEMILSSSVRYTSQVFSAIKASIEKVSLQYSTTDPPVSIEYERTDRWGNHFVKVSASDIDMFTSANEDLRRAVEPSIISFDDCKVSQYASTNHFRETVKKIQGKTTTYIKINSSSLIASSVMIYGSEKKCSLAKSKLDQHLQESVLQDGIECFVINLREYGPGLMKQLIINYGINITGLADDFEGVTATQLNPRRQVLTLFATNTAHQTFREALSKFISPHSAQQALSVPGEALTNEMLCVL